MEENWKKNPQTSKYPEKEEILRSSRPCAFDSHMRYTILLRRRNVSIYLRERLWPCSY